MNSKMIIKNYLSNNPKKILSVILLSILSISFKIMIPVCMKVILDYSLLSNNSSDFGQYVILFSLILGASIICSIIFDSSRQFKLVQFGNGITSELRSKAFQTIMKAEYYELNKFSNDELANYIIDETDLIGNQYISNKLIRIFYHALYLITLIVTLFVFNISFGLIVLLSIPLFYLADKYIGKYYQKILKKSEDLKHEHQYIINDRLKQLKTIKTRNGITEETENYEKILVSNKKIYSKAINVDKTKQILLPTIFICFAFLFVIIDLAIKFYGSNDYSNYLNSIGSLLGCVLLIPIIFLEFKKVIDMYYTTIDFDRACEKLDEIYVLRAESRSENVPSLEEVHSLKFNSISFDYAGYGINGKISLDKIDFELKKGERLGIIGLPGSGRSTIADLITKVIRPRQGNVLINNCDINKVNTQYLREIVTYVSSDYELLDMTIEKNITYPSVLDEYKYNEALNKCKLKDLIFTLPDRDETNARKVELSESDIQKIALAHVFYKESPIIILDEATSKLDVVTEDNILNEFYKLKNKISIVISNRISNIMKCDKILIINNGKVSEYGKVEDLLENKASTLSKMVNDNLVNKKVV